MSEWKDYEIERRNKEYRKKEMKANTVNSPTLYNELYCSFQTQGKISAIKISFQSSRRAL